MKKRATPEYAMLIAASRRWKSLSSAIADYRFIVPPKIEAVHRRSERLIAKGHRYPPPDVIFRSAQHYNAACREAERSLSLIPNRFLAAARERFYRIPLRQDQVEEQHLLYLDLNGLERFIKRRRCIAESGAVADLMDKIARALHELEQHHGACSCLRTKRQQNAA